MSNEYKPATTPFPSLHDAQMRLVRTETVRRFFENFPFSPAFLSYESHDFGAACEAFDKLHPRTMLPKAVTIESKSAGYDFSRTLEEAITVLCIKLSDGRFYIVDELKYASSNVGDEWVEPILPLKAKMPKAATIEQALNGAMSDTSYARTRASKETLKKNRAFTKARSKPRKRVKKAAKKKKTTRCR